MITNRNDIYARIHKGLRKALFEFSAQAGKTNPADFSQIDALKETGKRVFEFLELHAEVEEKYQLPYLAAIDPRFVSDDREEHRRLEKQIENLKKELSQFSDSENASKTLYQFYLKLNEFIGTYLLHMHHEENTTAGYFMQYGKQEDLVSMVNKINEFTTPGQKYLALQYFMPAVSHPERLEFLEEIRAKNRAAYENILSQTQAVISMQDWDELTQALGDDPGFSWFPTGEYQFISS